MLTIKLSSTVIDTTPVVATPALLIPTTSAGVIAPIAEVKPNPDKPIVISPTESAPTLDVKPEGAVNEIVGDHRIVGEPIADVAETPVTPITSATFKIKSPPQVTPTSPESEEPPQP